MYIVLKFCISLCLNNLWLSSLWKGCRPLILNLQPPSHMNALYKLWRLDKFGPVILMKWQKYNFRRQTDRRLTIAHLNLRCADKKHVCLKKNLRPLVLNLYELGIFTNFLSIIVFCITNYQQFMFMILNDFPCKRGN